MKSVPSIPENAPFTAEQRAWLNGFLAGVFYDQGQGAPKEGSISDSTAARDSVPKKPLVILYGSQTGSAEGLAKKVAKEAGRLGYHPTVLQANDYTKANLVTQTRLVYITSTWGDGDPPDNATQFWSWLTSSEVPRLEHLAFAVLGLGDKNYSDFCGASKKVDARLEALGARRLAARGECDVDYESTANTWISDLWPALKTVSDSENTAIGSDPVLSGETREKERRLIETGAVAVTPSTVWSKARPFGARLKNNRRLNREDSSKDTRHLEIDLAPSNLQYTVGDALGVVPKNCPVLVEELLAALNFRGEEAVATPQGQEISLHSALLDYFQITSPTLEFCREMARRSSNSELTHLLEPANKPQLDVWLQGRDCVDIARACGSVDLTPKEFVSTLRKLNPRLYSISSSPNAHLNEVHLTVAAVRYEAHGRSKKGVASCWLADRVRPMESDVPVFVQTSHGFRLPTDGSKPVIMVGPGTGIAPFRAFLEERRVSGSKGKNWLFFGDQRRSQDFLYEEQITAWTSDGHLERLDLAFSRDQTAKIYVQDRMLESAGELWKWLEDGAHFYVCGDAKRMAKDVDAALHQVIREVGGKTEEQAESYVSSLKTEKRYQRDVY